VTKKKENDKIAAEYIARMGGLNSNSVLEFLHTENIEGDKLAQAIHSEKISATNELLIALVGNDESRKKAIKRVKEILKELD